MRPAGTRVGFDAARLMAVADVYDAVVSRRVYKEARAHEVGLEVIANGRGTHFDPDMADAFLAIEEEIRAIAQRFRDEDADIAAKADRLAYTPPATSARYVTVETRSDGVSVLNRIPLETASN